MKVSGRQFLGGESSGASMPMHYGDRLATNRFGFLSFSLNESLPDCLSFAGPVRSVEKEIHACAFRRLPRVSLVNALDHLAFTPIKFKRALKSAYSLHSTATPSLPYSTRVICMR
jgi:hypothetical protein